MRRRTAPPGSAQRLLPERWAAPASLRLRAPLSLSLYRSKVEQLDNSEARLEGQPPWQGTLGFDRGVDARQAQVIGYGANFSHVPRLQPDTATCSVCGATPPGGWTLSCCGASTANCSFA